jgi:ribulose-phosphate 3-epimerase
MSNIIISPSILSADFGNLARDIEMLNESEADWIHCDIMDGVFVPNLSFGLPVVKKVRELTKKLLDVHLMIVEPDKYLKSFREAGADILTVQYEACIHLNRTVAAIRDLGMKAGVALNPHTPVALLKNILPFIDVVLIMSVNPGFGGQNFIADSLGKVAELRAMIDKGGYDIIIEVDGGVNLDNVKLLTYAGANALVAGNFIFSSDNPKKTIKMLKE